MKVEFRLTYEVMTFSIEDILHDCLDQIRCGQPDPHLWLEKARATIDVWFTLAEVGGVADDKISIDHQRLISMIDDMLPS